MKIPSVWEPSSSMQTDGKTDRHTDRHYDVNRRFPQFCERSLKTKTSIAPLWKPEVSHNRG